MTTLTIAPSRVDAALAGLPRTPAMRDEIERLLSREDRFNALRPACPSWCVSDEHSGDAVLHVSQHVSIESVPDKVDARGIVEVSVDRFDALDDNGAVTTTSSIRVSVARSGCLLDEAALTVTGARALTAALTQAVIAVNELVVTR